MPAFFAPHPDADPPAAPDGVRAAAAARVVRSPALAPFAGVLVNLDVDADPDAVDWAWIAEAPEAEVVAWLERVRDGRWWPKRED